MADFEWQKYAVNPGGSGIHQDANGQMVDARGNPVSIAGAGGYQAPMEEVTRVSTPERDAANGLYDAEYGKYLASVPKDPYGMPRAVMSYQTWKSQQGNPDDSTVVRGMENQPKSTTQPWLGAAAPTDFPSRIRDTIKQTHPDWTEAQVANQVQYYVNKNNDPNDRSAWATGEPGRTMEDYWIGRENGSISPNGGPGGSYSGGLSAAGFSPNAVSRTASFDAPGLLKPWTESYQAPNLTDDPGFQFRLQEGQKALERSAASKGTLLTGGTLKDLAGYAQGMASQEYGAADARAFRNYGSDQNTFWTNQNNAFNKLNPMVGYGLTAAGQGINAAGQAAQYATGYGTDMANLAIGQGNAGANNIAGQSNANSAMYNTLGNIDWKNIKFNNPFNNNPPGTGTVMTANSSLKGG